MQLPGPTVAYTILVRYGLYTARRVRRVKLTSLADGITRSSLAVRAAGRAWEDADDPTQEALADRDGADDDLDDTAQNARAALGGRGKNAVKKEPYILIFPEGAAYYTAASLGEEEPRYGELKTRLEEHLDPKDDVRRVAVPALVKGLVEFKKSVAAVQKAQTGESLAGTRLTVATTAFRKDLESAYGELVKQFGKAAADRFFPKAAKKKSKKIAASPAPGK